MCVCACVCVGCRSTTISTGPHRERARSASTKIPTIHSHLSLLVQVRKRTDSDYLRDFGLASMQSQLAQRIQATAQELAYVREALRHLGRLMVAMQTAPIDFFRLHINRRCAGGDTDN